MFIRQHQYSNRYFGITQLIKSGITSGITMGTRDK